VAVNQWETTLEKEAQPKAHEIETAKKLDRHGISVHFVTESKTDEVKMYDAITDKTDKAEFKIAKNYKNQTGHIEGRIEESGEKKADIMILDVMRKDYELDLAKKDASVYYESFQRDLLR